MNRETRKGERTIRKEIPTGGVNVSIPRRVALAARVRATAENAARVDRDRLRAPRHLGPIADQCELVTSRRETAPRGLREPRLDLERATQLVIPARLLDGPLDVEAVVDEADRELEVRLHLCVTAGRAPDKAWGRAVERDRRVERVHRPLARREGVR